MSSSGTATTSSTKGRFKKYLDVWAASAEVGSRAAAAIKESPRTDALTTEDGPNST